MHRKTNATTALLGTLLWGVLSSPISAQQVQTQLTDAPAAPALAAAAPAADAPLPTAHALLTKSDDAVGGLDAWNKATTRRMKGVYQTEDNSVFLSIEIFHKSPNKSLSKITLPNGMVIREVCDGQNAWIETSTGAYQAFTGAALASRIKLAEYEDRAKLEAVASKGKVIGTEKLGAHTAYVLEFSPDKKLQSRLYFDVDSGLIVRTEDALSTPDGAYTVRMDLDDYREVDGLKFPFRIKHIEKGAVLNIRLTQVTVNPGLDDSLFLKPEFAKN
jgi:zinc protease